MYQPTFLLQKSVFEKVDKNDCSAESGVNMQLSIVCQICSWSAYTFHHSRLHFIQHFIMCAVEKASLKKLRNV
jgi:hypothetical protein